jgi:hypothetical protein
MRGVFFFLLSVLLLTSCDPRIKRLDRPNQLIPKDTMVMVLRDLMLVEEHVYKRYSTPQEFHVTMKKSGDWIMHQYHIDTIRFDAAMEYYGSRQDEMQSIYNQVLDSVNLELSKLKK